MMNYKLEIATKAFFLWLFSHLIVTLHPKSKGKSK